MISINSLYEIISQLPFSIKGYQNDSAIDYHLNRLLDKMHEQKQNFANLNVRFFSFANARLADVLKWHLADYDKSFYFVPFIYSSNEDLYLNEYYSLKKVIKEYSTPCTSDKSWNEIVMSGKAAQISSVLFKTPIVYRVLCDNNVTGFSITYESGCISILIPSNCFSFYDQNKLPDEDGDYLPLIKKDNEYIPNENARKYRPLCEDGFTRYDYKRINKKIVEGLKNINIEHTIFKLYDEAYLHDAITGFANLLITHAYLSLILECWVESIPSVVNIDKKETNSLGIVIWGYSNECNISECRSLMQIVADKICTSFSAHFVDLLGLVNITQKESLKSAKAAIMSRNMSHNLGSHVMFYIKQKLQSVSKIVDNKVLENIIPGNIEKIDDIIARIKEHKDIELPFLVGLGRFINYLQERQDYIATVATDYIPARSTISFKDFVYDELKPDLRYERHYSQNNDAGWKSGNLLLDYIAYSEGYRSCDKIEILFGDFDGHKPEEDSSPDKDFQKLREFNIAVPGGVIGRQALFSIFENIIRNAAKHSERRSDNKLVLQLSLLEKDSELLKELKAKREKKKSEIDKDELKNLYSNHSDKYHFLRIKVDMPNSSGVIDTLVDNLADPYLDDNGEMSETTKGLKEMRISAAWLRGYSIDTDIPADEPPALSIYSEPYSGDDTKVTISYIICIPKPCRVAFVVECDKSDTVNGLLTPYGCKVFTPNLLNSEDNINEIANYEIVCMSEDNRDLCSRISSRYICNQDKSAELLEKLKGALTKNYEATLKQEAEQAQIEAEKNPTEENKKKAESAKENLSKVDDIKKKAINDAIGFIYEEWFNTVYNDITPKLVVADEKASKDKKAECEKLNEGKEHNKNVILKTTSNMTQKDSTDNVVYSTHFKGLGFDTTDYGQMLTASACIESVTGNNSTARLVRQDEWNEEWQYKLLSSGLAKVAIFDERIFSSFISRESKAKIDNLVNKIKEIKLNKPENTWKKEFIALGIEPGHAISLKTADEAQIQSIIETTYDVKYWYEVAQKNHERRIYAFDIRNVSEKQVDIVGYNVNIGKQVGAYPKHEKSPEVTIAQVTYDGKDVKVELTDKGQEIFKVDDRFRNTNKDKGSVFDYITIHQGVLDKIYTAFGIKNDEDEKYKVTNALHQCFSKQDTPTEVKKFLPNFIIHSGRSKPSKNDMPQEQPFVQFAAVDHAVKDCKHTLVELLASAHYEK